MDEAIKQGWRQAGIIAAILVGLGILLVIITRLLRLNPAVEAFIETYPGSYAPAEGTPVGIPLWLNWQHYLNALFMLLILRTAFNIRGKQRPPAFFTRRNEGRLRTKGAPRRMSIHVWLHLSMDLLWVINGLIYVILLFATGQWLRLIPTSAEVWPNALSAGIQYFSFQWPTDNPWYAYNALQMLAYAATVFIAAPLAIFTGIRLSNAWPLDAPRLNRVFAERPIRWLHNAILLYFVVFIVIHVDLVLFTGALRNLNVMYAANDGTSWAGAIVFIVSVLVLLALWFIARPPVVKAVASRFGKVQ